MNNPIVVAEDEHRRVVLGNVSTQKSNDLDDPHRGDKVYVPTVVFEIRWLDATNTPGWREMPMDCDTTPWILLLAKEAQRSEERRVFLDKIGWKYHIPTNGGRGILLEAECQEGAKLAQK